MFRVVRDGYRSKRHQVPPLVSFIPTYTPVLSNSLKSLVHQTHSTVSWGKKSNIATLSPLNTFFTLQTNTLAWNLVSRSSDKPLGPVPQTLGLTTRIRLACPFPAQFLGGCGTGCRARSSPRQLQHNVLELGVCIPHGPAVCGRSGVILLQCTQLWGRWVTACGPVALCAEKRWSSCATYCC